MELTENEYIALKYLKARKSNPDSEFDKPENLTKAQFTSALKNLEKNEFVKGASQEGGDYKDARLLAPGKAALDDLAREEKRALKNIIKGYNIDWDQYCLLKHAKEAGKADNIFGITDNEYHKIYGPCATYGYLRRVGGVNLQLTRNGENLLADIEDELNQQIGIKDSAVANSVDVDATPTKSHKTKPSSVYIADGRIADFIKIMHSLWEEGIFVDSNEKRMPITRFMPEAAIFFNNSTLKSYSSTLTSVASTENINTYTAIYDALREHAVLYYKNKDNRKR